MDEIRLAVVYPDGLELPFIRFGAESGLDLARLPWVGFNFSVRRRCSACNIRLGDFHQTLCPNNQCPRCFGQLLSCRCFPAKKRDVDGFLSLRSVTYVINGVEYIRGYPVKLCRAKAIVDEFQALQQALRELHDERDWDETDAGDIPVDQD